MFLGELSLDGSVRLVRGALSAALAAREFGLKRRGGGRGRVCREVATASCGLGEFA